MFGASYYELYIRFSPSFSCGFNELNFRIFNSTTESRKVKRKSTNLGSFLRVNSRNSYGDTHREALDQFSGSPGLMMDGLLITGRSAGGNLLSNMMQSGVTCNVAPKAPRSFCRSSISVGPVSHA